MRYKHVKKDNAVKFKLEGGELTSILASGMDTDNRVTIFDSKLPKNHGAPWHYHEIDDEIFYMITGEIEFGVEDESFIGYPGDLVIAGPNVKRKFKALQDSHVLVINAPSGPSEGFITEISKFTKESPATDKDKEHFIKKYKIHII
jgi:quercetin dioxygenase-like cupin family protein